jgi:hypothetical protein
LGILTHLLKTAHSGDFIFKEVKETVLTFIRQLISTEEGIVLMNLVLADYPLLAQVFLTEGLA